MLCPNCTAQMGKKNGAYQYKECGLDNIWLKDWPTLVCPECKISMPLLPNSDLIVPMITSVLIRERGRLDGDSIVFLRKAMGLKATALAQILGVDRVSVSRWENNKQEIDGFLDIKLRMTAIDQILPMPERQEARDAVSLVLQHTYTHTVSMGELTIDVPCNESMYAIV